MDSATRPQPLSRIKRDVDVPHKGKFDNALAEREKIDRTWEVPFPPEEGGTG